MSNAYNEAGVTTATPKADQYIFMDSDTNAEYDVDVLAGAFNMDKAEFIGKLKLIDDWTTFDNDRFDVIRENSDMIEPITEDELAMMARVKGVLVDREWFQVYDNLNKMTETYVASGLYWNYFYHVWKTVSSSPFSNAVVFMLADANAEPLESFTGAPYTISSSIDNEGNINARSVGFVFGVVDTSGEVPVLESFIDGVKLLQEGAFSIESLNGEAQVAVKDMAILYNPQTLGSNFDASTNAIYCTYKGNKYVGNIAMDDDDFDWSPITFELVSD